MIRALVRKELHENVGWAALMMAAFGAAMACAMHYPETALDSWVTSRTFLMATWLGAPLVGTSLGVLMSVRDWRGDRWALLVHRPVPRAAVFYTKALTGLTLYFLATGVPLLVVAAWVAWPGNVPAPFDVRLLLPSAAAILAGAVYVFAGMLVALRDARWWGSRILGAGVGVACTILALLVPAFWQVLPVVGIAACILLVAARGAFVTAGACVPQPGYVRFAIGLGVATGIVLVGTLVFSDRVYSVDLDAKRVRQVYTAAPGDEVFAAANWSPVKAVAYTLVET